MRATRVEFGMIKPNLEPSFACSHLCLNSINGWMFGPKDLKFTFCISVQRAHFRTNSSLHDQASLQCLTICQVP